jgi:hypothetical protein
VLGDVVGDWVGIATLGGTDDGDAGVDGDDVDVATTVVDGVSVGEGDGNAVDGDPVGDGVGDTLVTADGDAGVDGDNVDVANTVVDGASVGKADGNAVDGDPVGDGVGDTLVDTSVGRVGAVGEHVALHPTTVEI